MHYFFYRQNKLLTKNNRNTTKVFILKPNTSSYYWSSPLIMADLMDRFFFKPDVNTQQVYQYCQRSPQLQVHGSYNRIGFSVISHLLELSKLHFTGLWFSWNFCNFNIFKFVHKYIIYINCRILITPQRIFQRTTESSILR